MNKPSWLEQNPVDFYNNNKFDDALSLVLRKDKTLRFENNELYFVREKTKEIVAEKKCNNLVVVGENRLGLVEGMAYSPFQLLVRFRYKDNFTAAFQYVGMTFMDMDFPYIRVGTKYFKEILKPDRYGTITPILKPWSKEEIKQDYGKEMLVRVGLYDDFIMHPDNLNYHKTYKGFYNLYQPFTHKEKEFDLEDLSKIKWSLQMVRHIFGTDIRELEDGSKIDELALGLRYLKMLYLHPDKVAPILVMTSTERQTGKSTFINWLNSIFSDNLVIITPEHISSQFNESYAEKNIIAIEESRFDNVQALEKLKALSTLLNISVNRKHIPTFSIPFYGKIIITSNDERKFSKVDKEEIRYWVRKIPTLKGIANHNIVQDLIDEIPYFLYYLSQQPEIDFTISRQGFSTEEISTEALEDVKRESESALHKEIKMALQDFCLNETEERYLYFTATDIKNQFFLKNNQYNAPYISKVLQDEMELERERAPKRYKQAFNPGHSKTGLYFTFKNKYADDSDHSNKLGEIDDEPF